MVMPFIDRHEPPASGHPGFRIAAAVCLGSFLLSAAKALLAPITYDEAFSYLTVARHDFATVFSWYALPNNHILNSALMHVSTAVFGVEPIALRLPALTGTLLSFGALLVLCRLLRPALPWQAIALAALVPGMIDINGQARGYSSAAALAYCGAVMLVRHLRAPQAGLLCAAGVLFGAAHGFVPTVAYLTIGFCAAFLFCRLCAQPAPRQFMREALLLLAASAVPTAVVYHRIRIDPAAFPWGSPTPADFLREISASGFYSGLQIPAWLGLLGLAGLTALFIRDVVRGEAQELFVSGSVFSAAAVILSTHCLLGWHLPFTRSIYCLLPFAFAALLRLVAAAAGARGARLAGVLFIAGLAGRLLLNDSPRSFAQRRFDLQDIPEAARCLAQAGGARRIRVYAPWRLAPALQYEILRQGRAKRIRLTDQEGRAACRISQTPLQDEGFELLCRTSGAMPLAIYCAAPAQPESALPPTPAR